MKRIFCYSFFLFLAVTNVVKAQVDVDNNEDNIIFQNDKGTIQLNGAYDFSISKTDKSGKKLYDVKLNIPNKSNKEYYFPSVSKISTELVGKEIQIIYDVYSKKEALKDCYFMSMSENGTGLSAPKLLSSTACKSQFSNSNTNYRVLYSPDKSKFALLLDNFSRGIVIEPTITIYDSKTISPIVIKQLSSKYNGEKIQIDPYKNFTMDNDGNIKMLIHQMNMETNMVVKDYSGELAFADKAIRNIKELSESTSTSVSEGGEVNKTENGRFYASLEDVAKDKFIPGYQVKNGTYSFVTIAGESFKLIEKDGNLKKTSVSDFPSPYFTYKSSDLSDLNLMVIYKGKSYIVLAVGKFSFYSFYQNQGALYWSEGASGDLDKFKPKVLEKYLKQYGLFDDYEKDKPKREFHDSVNDYFNKQVSWWLKYVILLNKKM